jgi:hypothetical protein
MITPITLFKGDDMELIQVRPRLNDDTAVIDSNWVCEIAVMNEAREIVVPKRTVTLKSDDGKYFLAGLTSAETSLLTVAKRMTQYIFAVQCKNNTLSPAYNREKHLPLYVEREVVIES